METTMENGLYMAVPHYVSILLCLLLPSWIVTFCVYATYKAG